MPRVQLKIQPRSIRVLYRGDADKVSLDGTFISRRSIRQVNAAKGDGFIRVVVSDDPNSDNGTLLLRSKIPTGMQDRIPVVDEILDEGGNPVPAAQWGTNAKLASLIAGWML